MRGVGLIPYGDEGIGKTSFCLQAPKPLRCISIRETGYEDLDDVGEVPDGCELVKVTTYSDLMSEIKEGFDMRSLVLDSMSGLQQLMFNAIIEEIYKKQRNGNQTAEQAFGSFSEGPRIHGPIYAGQVETELTALRSQGTNIFLIGHSKIEKLKNPQGFDYLSAEIDMEKWPRAIFTKWAQAVLYMTLDLELESTRQWKGKTTEAKAKVGDYEASGRIMYTEKTAGHSAKNRLRLPTYIEMGDSAEEAYSNFVDKLPDKIKESLLQ